MSLTELSVKHLRTNDRLYRKSDGSGLFIVIHPNGSKYWQYRYKHYGRERTLSLGIYPDVKLSDARKKHIEARKLIIDGHDPMAVKAEVKRIAKLNAANSFEAVALEWIEARKEGWTEKYVEKVRRQLDRHAFPKLGARPIKDINPMELLEMLRRIENRGTLETAHRVKQTCGLIFSYAIATGRAERNPARDITGALKTPKKKNNPHLDANQLPEFFQKLESYDGEHQTKLAVKLALLTGVRTTELRGAPWSEINFEKKEWRIPAERMKMRQPHIVPLSTQTLAVLKEMHNITGNMPYICSHRSEPRKYMSENTMLYALYRIGYHGRLTVHGFRGTMSTILNENGFNRDHIERQLAHAERDKVRSSYNHTDYLPARHKMMQWWGDYLGEAGLACEA